MVRSTILATSSLVGAALVLAALGTFADGVTVLPTGPLVITGEYTLANAVYTMDRPIVVLAGATLIVANATLYLDWEQPCGEPDACPPDVLVAGGTVRIADSRVTTHHASHAGGKAWSIQAYEGVVLIDRSTLEWTREVRLQHPGEERSRLADSTILHARVGFRAIRGAEANITNNVIEDAGIGIQVTDGHSIIANNVVRLQPGASTGIGIEFIGTALGRQLYPATTEITGNRVEGGGVGIQNLNSQPNRVHGNTLVGNQAGANLGLGVGITSPTSEGFDFVGNTIDGALTAVHVFTSAERTPPDPIPYPVGNFSASFHGNTIVNTQCVSVDASNAHHPYVTLHVDATDNWWGSVDGPQPNGPDCPTTRGNVTVAPWLESAP